jgi:hypothetical protein
MTFKQTPCCRYQGERGMDYRTRRRGVGFLVQAILPSGDGEFVVVNAVEPSHKRAAESLQVPTGAPGFVCLRQAADGRPRNHWG